MAALKTCDVVHEPVTYFDGTTEFVAVCRTHDTMATRKNLGAALYVLGQCCEDAEENAR